MSKVKDAPFLRKLKQSLRSELAAVGIEAKVHTEAVPTTQLYRVTVVAPQFKVLNHSERQNVIWRIVEKSLSPQEQLRISMIMTLAADEI